MSHTRIVLGCAAALAVAALGGCKKKDAEPAPAASQTPPTATAPKKVDLAAAAQKRPASRSTLVPIAVDEVEKLMPAPAGSRTLKALAKAAVGERVVATYCFDEGELAELMPALEKTYKDAGWDQVTVRPNPKLTDRAFVIGQKAPYTLSGSLQRGAWAECDQTKGQTYLLIGAHHLSGKLTPGEATQKPVGPPGTTGATIGGSAGPQPAPAPAP
jgi:hypothetical protein